MDVIEANQYVYEWYNLKTLRADAIALDKWGYVPAPWQVDRVKENSIGAIEDLTRSLKELGSSHYMAQDVILNEIVGIKRVLKRLRKKYPENFI